MPYLHMPATISNLRIQLDKTREEVVDISNMLAKCENQLNSALDAYERADLPVRAKKKRKRSSAKSLKKKRKSSSIDRMEKSKSKGSKRKINRSKRSK